MTRTGGAGGGAAAAGGVGGDGGAGAGAGSASVPVVVNGRPHEMAAGSTLDDLVELLGFDRRGLAIAVDDEVVSRSAWSARRLAPGERVEVLTIAQGG